MAKLIIVTEPNIGLEYPLFDHAILGRHADNEVPLSDQKTSRQHSRIFYEQGNFYIEDLQSRNGTLVNSKKITKQKLVDGDKIQIGETVLIFVQDSETQPNQIDKNIVPTDAIVATKNVQKIATIVQKPKIGLAQHQEIADLPDLQEIVLENSKFASRISATPTQQSANAIKIKQSTEQEPTIPNNKDIQIKLPLPSPTQNTNKAEVAVISSKEESLSPSLVLQEIVLDDSQPKKSAEREIQICEPKRDTKTKLDIPTIPSNNISNNPPLIQQRKRILSSAQYRKSLKFWEISFSEYSTQQRCLFFAVMILLIFIMIWASRWLTLWILN